MLDMPYYNPVTLARRLTTIDILSKGRLNVGLGQGWSPDELEATGADMKVRGARADDGIARDTPNLMPDHRVRVLAGGVGGITIAVKPRVDCAASIACPFRFSLRLGTSSAGAGKYSDLEGLRESADRVCVKSEARGKSGR